jgi:hypothetical protein
VARKELIERFEAAQQPQRLGGLLDRAASAQAPLLGEPLGQSRDQREPIPVPFAHKLLSLRIPGGEPDELAHEDVLRRPKAAPFLERAPGGLDGVRERDRGDDSLLPAPALDVV